MPDQVAITLPVEDGLPAADYVALAELAERCGCDAVLAGEVAGPEVFSLLGMIAARTTAIRILMPDGYLPAPLVAARLRRRGPGVRALPDVPHRVDSADGGHAAACGTFVCARCSPWPRPRHCGRCSGGCRTASWSTLTA